MSDKIDQRIVEMSFENKKFEKGISQSTSSLKEFSNMLNKGFDKDFSSLEKSVDSVSYSLSMMEQIGIGALRRIGESAIDAGAKMIKSLSVDQLAAGWTKYEEKLDAVQTLISAGYDMSSVRKEMDQLMWFADETSYSFSDMANNMGKFVAAGVDLKTSSKAMQGIATWAAHSGKNTDSASIAMFNLSQAISMGYVDTLNWRSIMNQNMNTKMFKQVAIGVAEATGAVEKGAVTIQNFDSNLKTKWFSNDILLKTLDQYSSYAEKVREVQEEMEFGTANQAMEYMDTHADEYADVLNQIGNAAFKASQESKKLSDSIIATMDAVSSGWLRTYEIIFGELDEAKANFTALTEILWIVFASGAENRNEMLLWLKEAGGITNVFKGFKNVAIALLTLLKPISEAFDQIFPPKTKEQWLGMTKSFREFTDSLIISEKAADKVRRTFAGVFAVIDIGWQVLKFLGQAAFEVAKIFLPLGGTFLGASASLGDFLVRINYVINSLGIFQYGLLAIKIGVTLLRQNLAKLINGISEFAQGLWNAEKPFDYLMNAGTHTFSTLLKEIKMVTNWISNQFGKAIKNVSKLFGGVTDFSEASVLSSMFDILKEIVFFIGNEAVESFQNFGDVVKNLDFHKIATFVVGGVLLIFVKQLSDLTGAMTNFTNSVTGAINGFSKKFLGTKTTSMIRDMAYAIGILAASIWVLSGIPIDDLNKSLIGLAKTIGIFVVAYGLLQGINVATAKIMKDTEMVSSAFGLTAVAASLLIMATAVKTISKIDESKVWTSVGVLGAMFGFITAYQVLSALISRIPGQKKISMDLLGMSASILILVGALALLNLLTFNDIKDSVTKTIGILLVLGGLQVIFGLAARFGGNNKVSISILSMASGILAMVVVLKLLSFIDSHTITQSIGNLALITLLLAGIEIIMGLASRISGGNKAKSNILSVQFGLLVMIGLIKILGTMKQEDINRGILNLAKMTGIIAAIELFTAISARIAGGAKVQRILGSVSITLLAFAGVIAILGIFDKSVIDQGILTLTKMVGLIVTIELLTGVASRISGNDKMFVSLIGATLALLALTGSLALLSMIDQESLRNASISLSIASVAILALSLAMDKISGTVNLLSKGSQGFLDKVKSIGITLMALGTLFVITAAFFKGIELFLPIIESISFESFGKFIAGITTTTALLVILNTIPIVGAGSMARIKGLLPGFVAVTAVLIGAMGFFGALKLILPIVDSINWDSLTKFTVGLGVVIVLLGAMALLSPIFAIVGGLSVSVLLGVVIVIASLALVVLSIIGLAEVLNWMIKDADALTRGLDLLVEVGAGIGRFIGAIAGGLTGGVLEGIGHSLAAFVESLSGFSSESLHGIKALAEAILIITGTSIIAGITGFMTGKSSMEIFGEQIADLVSALNKISPENAAKASDILAVMKPMAENLKLFAEAAKEIPNSGGFLGDFMGENNIDTFGIMLVGFIAAFKNITPEQATHMTNVLAAMKPMAENLKLFAEAAKEIPNSGGFLGDFMGENNIDDFGIKLVNFVRVFENVTIEQAKRSTNILAAMKPMAANLKLFAEAAQEIPPAGGFLSVFLGSVDLPTFSKQIYGLIETFGSINNSQLLSATSSLETMSETMLPALIKFSEFTNNLKASGGLAQFFSGNTTLSEFGLELRKFVDHLSNVDFEIIAPAMEAMGKLTTSFGTMGANVIGNAKKSFENNKEPFQKIIATILDEPIKKLEAQKQTLVKTVSSIFKAVTDKGDSYIKEFKKLGANLIEGLKSGIESKQPSAVTAVKKVMSSVVSTAQSVVDAQSPSRVFETIGGWCTKGLANGISKETDVAVKAGINMAKATEEGIRDALDVHSDSDLFIKIGNYVPKSIGKGYLKGKSSLLNTAKNLGIDTGKQTIYGLASTVPDGESSLTTGINSLLEILTDTTIGSASSTGTNLGNSLTSGFQNALSNSSTGLGGSSTRATVKSELDKLKEVIEERSFYGQITVEEELEMYQQLRESYKEGSEERKQIDREIYTRLKTIYDAQISYIESVQNAQKDAADERTRLDEDYVKNVTSAKADASKELSDLNKKYNEDVSKANLDANKKREDQEKSYYKKLNSILDNAEQERQNLREQYASNQKSINEKLLSDIDAQNKAYENAVKSRADAIYNSYSLFAAVEPDVEITGDELLKNLQDQGAALSEWKQSLAALTERGVGDAFIEELQAMGPSTKAQIKALLTLTDEQLTEYVGLFEGKYTFARIKAEQELEGLKNSTIQTIQDLNEQAAIDLNVLEVEFTTSMTEINTNMANDMSELRETHNEALAEINRDLQEKLNDLETKWKTSSSKIKTDLDAKLKELETAYNGSMTKIDTDLKKNLDDMKTKFGTTMKEVSGLTEKELSKLIADNKTKLTLLNTDTEAKLNEIQKIYGSSSSKIVSSFGSTLQQIVPNTAATLNNMSSETYRSFESISTDFKIAGINAAFGFAKGIELGVYQVINAAEYLARAAINAAENILDEHSPSKVFEGIGKFVSMGFANGIVAYANRAEKASEDMVYGPIAAVSQALAEMEDSNDLSLTITPVLDLSNLRSTEIAQLLKTPIHLGSTSGKLASDTIQNGNRETTPVTSIVNKFDLTGLTVRTESDVDAIATKLYQKQQAASRGRGLRAPARA